MCIFAGRASFVAGSAFLLAGRGKIVAGSAVVVAGSRIIFGGRDVAIEMRRSGIRKYFSEINSRNQYVQWHTHKDT